MTLLSVAAVIAAAQRRLDAAGRIWFDAALASARQVDALCRSYTEASRHVGRAPLDSESPGFSHWTVDDAVRCALLQAASECMVEEVFVTAATECYERGDSREQQSWLRGVSLLPRPERFAATAIEACRTNIVPLFESIACENPYPARYFPERNFNQMVLKALFNAIALRRITGLQERLNPELSRMARDYAAERRAAGRSVPADIEAAIQ